MLKDIFKTFNNILENLGLELGERIMLNRKGRKKYMLYGSELTLNQTFSVTFCYLPVNAGEMLQDNVHEADQNYLPIY